MQSAVLYGLAQPSDTVSKQATFTCDAGNCTWPVFESLAGCSSCNDLSENVVNYTDINWGNWRLGDVADLGLGLTLSWNATTFQMPNGHVLNNLNGYINDSTNLATVMTTFGTGNASKTSSFKDNDSLIWAMSFLAIPPSMPMSATWPNIPIIAEECALYYCVNHYNASVTSGILNIEVTQAKAPRNPQSWQFGRAESGWNETASSIASLEFNNITSTPDRTDLEFGDGFNVSQEAVDSISLYFQSQFAISSDLNSSWVPRQNDTSEAIKDELVTLNGFILNQNYFPSALQAFHSSPNLTSRFEALAKSMSNTIQADADNGTVQTGSAYITATRYKIQWEWMALHAVLHITVGMFLWMTIRETKTSGAPLWKSNALAPFLCCTELGNSFDDVASVKVMEQKASQYFVRLGAKSLTEGSEYNEPGSPNANRQSKSPSLSLYPVT